MAKPALTYRVDKKNKPRPDISDDILRAGYLHPVRSPSGAIVTGDYPANHPHHHGIWTPYTKAVFQGRATDFWNMQNKKGRVDLVNFGFSPGSGAVFNKLDAMTGMVDLTGPKEIVALWEHSNVILYDIPGTPKPMVVFDLITEQACATNDPLDLPEYHYGSFGLRGPDEWNGKDGARFLTSEGTTDRKKGDSTRARWCYLGGKTSAGISGTAVLGFPTISVSRCRSACIPTCLTSRSFLRSWEPSRSSPASTTSPVTASSSPTANRTPSCSTPAGTRSPIRRW
jgi:hypothetical protein